MPTHAFQDCCFQCPYPHSRQLTTHASIGDLQTLTRQVWLSLSWGHCSFPLGPGMHKIFCVCVCPPRVCFLESFSSSVIKSHYPSKSDSQLNSFQSLSRVRLFGTPWTAARQASLSITNSWRLLKIMSIELVMPSNHLCHPLSPPAFNLSQHQALFKGVSSSHQVAKVLEFQLQHQSF